MNDEYTKVEKSQEIHIEALTPVFTELNRAIRDAEVRKITQQKSTKERFNVFTAVLKASDEVRLHSRFLHYLLNPDESHDCGRLFLDLFLDVIGEKEEDFDSNAFKEDEFKHGQTEKMFKTRELKSGLTENLFMDLYFRFAKHELAIENKIYAGELPNQIKKYNDSLKNSGAILFLTLDGKASETAGITNYIRISYEKHILPWLDECLKASYQYVNINQVIQQYKTVVTSLVTPNKLEEEAMEELEKILKKNPSVFKYIDKIKEACNSLEPKLVRECMDGIIKKINNCDNGERFEFIPVGTPFETNKYGSYKIIDKKSNIATECKYDFVIERYLENKTMNFGLAFGQTGANEEKIKKVLEKLYESVPDKYKSYGSNEHWPIGGIQLSTDFINNESLPDYIGEDKMQKKVDEFAKTIIDYIDCINECYANISDID